MLPAISTSTLTQKSKTGVKVCTYTVLFPYPLGILNEVGSQAPYEVP